MSKTPNQVFVLDADKKPLTPCLPVIARKLLNAGKVKVFKLYPFTIILGKSVNDLPEPIEIRIDPGSKTTGAACCGDVSQGLTLTINQPLLIKAMGWGSRQVVQTDKYGFPRSGYKPKKKVAGWNTGDIVSVIGGKHQGVKCKRIKTTRFKGNFDIRVNDSVISVSRNQLKPVHRSDGYNYSFA